MKGLNFLFFFFVCISVQAQNYTVTDLGVLPGQLASTPTGINNQGEVSGHSGLIAFLYSGGMMRSLGTLPGWAARLRNPNE